jgi:hypothetical protein
MSKSIRVWRVIWRERKGGRGEKGVKKEWMKDGSQKQGKLRRVNEDLPL